MCSSDLTVTGLPSGRSTSLLTGKQGSVTVDVEKTDTSMHYETGYLPPYTYCPASGDVPLPFEVRDNWIRLTGGCAPPTP